MWTASALACEARAARGLAWRAVEAQHQVATRRLTDSDDEQRLLEDVLEATKPPYPPGCRHLHYLLKTPFRYGAPRPHGSRFRRAGAGEGVFYAAEAVRTALAETAFYRLLFFEAMERPRYPTRPVPLTVFAVRYRSERCLDLTAPPLSGDRARWTDPRDYTHTQALAETAREATVEIIRYESVRDPQHGANVALLNPAAFAQPRPVREQSWHLMVRPQEVSAWHTLERDDRLRFPRRVFEIDGRLQAPWS